MPPRSPPSTALGSYADREPGAPGAPAHGVPRLAERPPRAAVEPRTDHGPWAALVDPVALDVVSGASIVLLAVALLRVASAGSPALGATSGRLVGAPASDLRFAVERCTTAVEIDGWLHCDRDPVPLAEPVPVGRRVDGRGRPRGPDGWLPGAAFEALALPVDVESADVERLASLPGIGPRRAAEIVARRPLGGRAALDDLPGIGPATWARLRTRVRFAPALRTPAPPTAVTPGAARRR